MVTKNFLVCYEASLLIQFPVHLFLNNITTTLLIPVDVTCRLQVRLSWIS